MDDDPGASPAARSAPGCRRAPAFELSLDIRTETNEAETLRVRSIPIQASLLLFPARGAFSPYVLGGGGWYSQRFEMLAGDETVLSETVRDFGWHAGFGAELRMGRHAGLHGDYRYTFLDFGGDDDDDDDGGVIGGGLVTACFRATAVDVDGGTHGVFLTSANIANIANIAKIRNL